MLREPLGDHHRRDMRESRRHVGHDRRVDDAEAFDAKDLAGGIDDGSHCTRADRVRNREELCPDECLEILGLLWLGAGAVPAQDGLGREVERAPVALRQALEVGAVVRFGNSMSGGSCGSPERRRTDPRECGRRRTASALNSVSSSVGSASQNIRSGVSALDRPELWKVAIVCRAGAARPEPW